MSFFDVPHNGYGSHPNPVMIFAYVVGDDLKYLKERCTELEINFERWFITGKEDEAIHEALNPGTIVYYPQYNCVRNADHMGKVPLIGFVEFFNILRKHPKHFGSLFIKTPDVLSRQAVIRHYEAQGYNLFKSIPTFDHELAIHISTPSKLMVTHANRRADENAEEGYPVMTYEDFKIYMQ